MTRGLVGYWSFDEATGTTVYDASNYGNAGTLTNGPKWATGKVGGALQFDGVDDYVDCGSDASLNMLTSDWTAEAWFKTTQITRGTIFRKNRTDAWDPSYYIEINVAYEGDLEVRISDGTNTSIAGRNKDSNVNDGQWHHVAMVRTSTQLLVFLDGNLWDSGDASAVGSVDTNEVLVIGREKQGASLENEFDGLIDEVRIYNRALSAEEIRYHYNRGGPVAHWKFDEGSGTTTYDGTNNNNDGTLGDGTCTPGQHPSSCPAWITGKFGSALSFDGVDDYVDVPDTTGSVLDISSSISLEAWVYPRSFPGSDNATVVTKSGSYYLSINTSGKAQAYLDGTTNPGYHIMDTTLTLNAWNHLIWTYDGANVKLYLNGALDKTVADTGSISTTNWVLGIGAEKGAGDPFRFFDGLIDDVRIYNYARTADEIALDYNAGLATHFK
jgi:hypothetical protein